MVLAAVVSNFLGNRQQAHGLPHSRRCDRLRSGKPPDGPIDLTLLRPVLETGITFRPSLSSAERGKCPVDWIVREGLNNKHPALAYAWR